ncbi:MAG: sulfatase-like hydrolase/transferase [bacterium]
MHATNDFQTRFKYALPIFVALLGLLGGVFDALRVHGLAAHLFNGFVDTVAFFVFAIGVYSLIGLALAFVAAFLSPRLFLVKQAVTGADYRAYFAALLFGLSFAVLMIVEKINFFYFSLNLIKNSAIVLGILIGAYLSVPLLFRLFSKGAAGAVLGKVPRLFQSRIVGAFLLVLFLLSAIKVLRVPSTRAAAPEKGRPNIILISFDTLAAQHMSCYGYSKLTTPNMDRFAEEGALFLEHFSVSRSTLPSHMSLLTSLYPSVHKVVDSFSSILDDRFTTLAEALKENGYETGAFVDGNRKLNIGADHGFDQGFDFYEHHPDRFFAYEKLYLVKRLLNFLENFLHSRGLPDMHSDNIFEGMLSWLSRREDARPFFAFLHTYDVHSDFGTKLPYVAPKEFRQFEYKDYRGDFTGCNAEGVCATDFLGQINKRIRRGTHTPEDLLTDEDVKFITSLYDCGIEYTDFEFGRFEKALKKMGVLDNTIVVLTSDHGEEFFQHDQLKHNQYFDEVIKVPLIMRYPAKVEQKSKVTNLTRSIDILPTILDLAEIEIDSSRFQGVSLLPLMSASPDFDDLVLFAGEDRPVDIETKVVRTSGFKYISVGGERRNQIFYRNRTEQLYNLSQDPGELQNIFGAENETSRTMRKRVDDWAAQCDDFRFALAPEQITKKMEIDKKTIKELESLGYIK